MTADLSTNTATGWGTDTLANFEGLVGSLNDDLLTGDATDNLLDGRAGNDTLSGGEGSDGLDGDAGNDILDGGPGPDLAFYDYSPNAVVASLASHTTRGWGTDTLRAIEDLHGSQKSDVLVGNGGPNVLDGHKGSDRISGGGGNDLILGEQGDERLFGGPGRDRLVGGPGKDSRRRRQRPRRLHRREEEALPLSPARARGSDRIGRPLGARLAAYRVAEPRRVTGTDLSLPQGGPDAEAPVHRRPEGPGRDDGGGDTGRVRLQKDSLEDDPSAERAVVALEARVLSGEATRSERAELERVRGDLHETEPRANANADRAAGHGLRLRRVRRCHHRLDGRGIRAAGRRLDGRRLRGRRRAALLCEHIDVFAYLVSR